ncbi:aldose 1-epimerase family protein [uncultured Propionibacterium sp.]|uniref:aldose 1-epimerase family protein n=1 Tax=uncultured Propionibacterium sp. TaxID=218066 RepID=UPI00293103F3|nr:aldose 1-epimerase family protein [uncultured Propionibacterium sp.]
MNRNETLARVGSMQQLAFVRSVRHEDGRAGGMRTVEVKNGPLRFTAMADKALDVAALEYRGQNLTFTSKPGLNGRNPFDTHGEEAQRSIMGGLFFTCGFENIGAPWTDPGGHEYPMHGRLRTSPAEHVGYDAAWEGDDYVLSVQGEVREAELFGENLLLRRRLSTRLGQDGLDLADEVINEAPRDEPMMLMYHCNIGWPLLAPGAEVVIPSLGAAPRNETTAADPTPWSTVEEPRPGIPESVYLHTLAAADDGSTFAGVVNDELGLALVVEFSTREFPFFMEWKSMASGDYVVGLEPSNSSVHGRGYHEGRGDLHRLPALASETKHLRFTVLSTPEGIAALRERRDALLASA